MASRNNIINSAMSESKSYASREGIESKNGYVKREFIEMENYIKDLESTLAINKEIISELIKKTLTNEQERKILESLNSENTTLHKQFVRTMKERDEARAKLLISDQIINHSKKHEEELIVEMNAMKSELVDQLNRKEFRLQKLEKKYDNVINVLESFRHKDQAIKKLLDNLNADKRTDYKISNVLTTNNYLQEQLLKEKEKVKTLTSEISAYRTVTFIESKEKPLSMLSSCNSSVLKINEATNLIEENGLLKSRVEELYRLNVIISNSLKEANQKLFRLNNKLTNRRKKSMCNISRGKSQDESSKETEQGVMIRKNKFFGMKQPSENFTGEFNLKKETMIDPIFSSYNDNVVKKDKELF